MHRRFRGGTHPPDHKHYAKDCAIADAPVPDELVVPLSQHIGKPAEAVVQAGEAVRRGQLLGRAAGFVSAAVHSPVSGTVKKLVETPHPLGMKVPGVLLENDHADAWAEGCNETRGTGDLDAAAIVTAVQEAGIVGMGGATFPTHVKLSPPKDKPIDTVILNGVECEPFLTADHRLMLESPTTILEGMRLVMRAVGATAGIVGIEANKPDAADAIRSELADAADIRVEVLPVMYPQGGEKQLIAACTGREVPSGGLPMDIGVVVQNVGTAHAVWEACARRRPLTERITTVTGPGVGTPQNLRVRIGTPVSALLAHCGYDAAATRKLVLGGPMTGPAQFDTTIPVNKGTSGVLALTEAATGPHRDCIRCGRCVDGCPAGLVPSQISILAERGECLETKAWDVLDCIECGVCTYVCPARRPIVHWVKVCKGELARQRAEAQAAATS